MSADIRRAQILPGQGTRVVLIMPGPDPAKLHRGDDTRLSRVLGQLAGLGWHLIAVVEPSQHLNALRMVLDGMADLVVTTRPQDFPLVRLAIDLGGESSSGRRTQRIPRPEMQAQPAPDHRARRPLPFHGLVDRTASNDAVSEPVAPQRNPPPSPQRTKVLRGTRRPQPVDAEPAAECFADVT